MPPYRQLTDAERAIEYAKEPNMTAYLSSAYYQDHWSYAKTIDTFKSMLDDTKRDFCVGLPYQISVEQGLMFREDIEDEMTDSGFSEIRWSVEMMALFWGDEDGSFFSYEDIARNRRINYPIVPDWLSSKLSSPLIRIPPKKNGEKRILSVDIALMASTKHSNDATAIFVTQLMPNKVGRYTTNVMYLDDNEGLNTTDEALVVRKYFDEFDCDYLALDCAGRMMPSQVVTCGQTARKKSGRLRC